MAIRTESLTIRIDPRTKYLGQIAAAQRRVSLSSLIDDTLLEAVRDTAITESNVKTSLLDMADELWADEESDRMVMLAERLDFLLSDEQKWIWEKVQSSQKYWLKPLSEGLHNVHPVTFNFEALRADWTKLKAKAKQNVGGA